MRVPWLRFWPECLIVAALTFFAFRELGTFPEAWADDSLFMIVARNLAEGRGYMLPVFDQPWHFSYFLAIGPTVILPSALGIWLFGFSVEAARLGMIPYLFLATLLTYRYAHHLGGRNNAILAAALLVTFSAFINTGKPVMGEIPAVCFLLLGFLALRRTDRPVLMSILAGVMFGIAVSTKITAGVVLPALGTAWIAALIKRDRHDLFIITITGMSALVTFVAFFPVLGYSDPTYLLEFRQYALADDGGKLLSVLRDQPELLLRFQFLTYMGLTVLAGAGMIRGRARITRREAVVIATIVLLISFHFLNERGWYRHLLTAHLLMIPLIPIGARAVLGTRFGYAVIAVLIAAQAWWQLDYRGAGRSQDAAVAAEAIAALYADTDLVVVRPEVYARLPWNPKWRFVSDEFLFRTYAAFADVPVRQEQHCLPVVQRLSTPDRVVFSGRITEISERYGIIAPSDDCTPVSAP